MIPVAVKRDARQGERLPYDAQVEHSAPRSPLLVAGSLVVAYLLATSRWGSHVGIPPVYLTDVLLSLAIVHASVSWRRSPTRVPLQLIWLLLTWTILRYIFSPELTDEVALRDLAPYLYAGVALLSAGGAIRATPVTRVRTGRLLWVALVSHSMWVAFALYGPEVVLPAVGGGAAMIFDIRDDADAVAVGTLSALAFWRWGSRGGRGYLLLACGTAFLVLSLNSRAGLLALAAASAIAVVLLWGEGSVKSRRRLLIVPALLTVTLLIIPSTAAGARFLAGLGYTHAEASLRLETASAVGTTAARERSWGVLTDWLMDNPSRSIVGVGFGPDFLFESHASHYLLGDEVASERTVRSPHNYFLGTWSRLGLPGLALVIALTVRGLRDAVRRQINRDDLNVVAASVVMATLPTAAFGVTMESPFGAIPFFWAIGILAADRRREDLLVGRVYCRSGRVGNTARVAPAHALMQEATAIDHAPLEVKL